MKKKLIIIIIPILLIIFGIIYILVNNNKTKYDYLKGRWESIDGTLIKVIKEYKNDTPIYENDNIISYWLDIKNNNTYILYYNDISDKGRSNYNIEERIIEKGNYNIDSHNKNIIYFNPNKYNHSYIWTCEINNNKELHNCNNYAYDFIKQ